MSDDDLFCVALDALRGVQRRLHLGATAFDDDLATLCVNGQGNDVLFGSMLYLHKLFAVGNESRRIDPPNPAAMILSTLESM